MYGCARIYVYAVHAVEINPIIRRKRVLACTLPKSTELPDCFGAFPYDVCQTASIFVCVLIDG